MESFATTECPWQGQAKFNGLKNFSFEKILVGSYPSSGLFRNSVLLQSLHPCVSLSRLHACITRYRTHKGSEWFFQGLRPCLPWCKGRACFPGAGTAQRLLPGKLHSWITSCINRHGSGKRQDMHNKRASGVLPTVEWNKHSHASLSWRK